ncbi:MAG: 5'/3'-nucleotidase SurE, partial [Clostridia bacterium]|nr:5'/3'-nucleotidase SurE [Clostridia bacterium]
MRILITNDDGMLSPVLPPLVNWAKKLGDVTVVVPKTEQSGQSHA